MKKLIEFLSEKHLITNFITILVLVGGIFFWNVTGKEESPDITMDMVFVSASYPGATAEEVESLVTVKIEDALDGIDGISSIESSSGQGSCSVRIELRPNNPNHDEVIDDIKTAVDSVRMPDDMEDPPVVRELKPAQRSIIDFVLINKNAHIMTTEQRRAIQALADSLEDRLQRLPEVSEVNMSGYREEYIEIRIRKHALIEYSISVPEIISAIRKNNLEQPVGALADDMATKIRLDAALDDIEKIRNVIIRGSFEGSMIRLSDVADVVKLLPDEKRISKANGREAVTLTVTKTSGAGILEAVDNAKSVAAEFTRNVLSGGDVELIVMDDESRDVRNRLELIASNGLLGFILIALFLFIFLDARSSIWVAMGIPFSLGFTMIVSSLMGYTINNMTLAAVIIVLGMVVDDAIVVAENVGRLAHSGVPLKEAIARGTSGVFVAIFASVTTTMVAFVPLFFFQGHFALMIKFIPPVIFLMLGASLLESIFILPSHLLVRLPRIAKIALTFGLYLPIEKRFLRANKPDAGNARSHWFLAVENAFGKLLYRALEFKWLLFIVFAALLTYSGWFFFTNMKYTLFPREETTTVFITGNTPEGTLRFETERLLRQIEEKFAPYMGKEVVGYRTEIARSRRGAASRENSFSIEVEIVPKDKRKKSASRLITEWEGMAADLPGFETLQIERSRWGQSSGSAIDILVKEYDDTIREKVADEIVERLSALPSVKNSEKEVLLRDPEYRLRLDSQLATRLGISTDTIATTLRTVLQGSIVYTIAKSGKETDVIVSFAPDAKNRIDDLLMVPIQNTGNYLVPLGTVVSAERVGSPSTIARLDGKRILHVYAELVDADNTGNERKRTTETPAAPHVAIEKDALLPASMTPLELADYCERNIFPAIMHKYPSVDISFGGEVQATRESGTDFQFAMILVVFLVYIIIAFSLNSLGKPLIIMLSIPFGCVGIILAFQLHGLLVFGFFSVIGALGLAGVVVNDAIVLLTRLEEEYKKDEYGITPRQKVANITKTRLRAVLLTTLTTVAGLLPTAYGVFGYDSMLAEMMLAMAWGLLFGTFITLLLVPSMYCFMKELGEFARRRMTQ